MSTSPRVRRMVMFKHGVTYLERGGPADGPFELSFKRDEMNDVLKSLAVWVAKGNARVGSISFEAPEDPEVALAARKLSLEPGAALSGLLLSLRGRTVRLHHGSGFAEGQVVGVEEVPASGALGARRLLVLRTAPAQLSLLDLVDATRLEVTEDPSRADLEFLVDRSRAATAGDSRTVRIALAGHAEDLRVAYVIPAPVWRVSYRLVRETDTTLLMGWGIIHNPADEDLEEIELTLTTGQPVSFVIDLYHPKMVERVVVEEQERTASPPARYEQPASPTGRGGPPPLPEGQPRGPQPPAPTITGDADPANVGSSTMILSSLDDTAPPAERGEFFEYRVGHRVTLKRGGSAMVPIIAATVRARLERLWRDGQGASPDQLLSFDNTTHAVLEEGPAVVYDGGSYAGEAMLPYCARGGAVKLGFAKDLAVRCRRATRTGSVVSGVRLTSGSIIEELRREETHTLVAESDHEEPVDVLFELPRFEGRALVPGDTPPLEETAAYRRFRVTVPPHGSAELPVVERWADVRHVRYEQLSVHELASWLEGRFLDRGTHDALASILQAWAQGKSLDEQRVRVEREQQEAYTKQQQMVEQLGVLKDSGQEGSLRLRYVKELEREQDKINHCEGEIRRLRESAEQARRFASQTLSVLVTHAERARR